MKVKYNSFPIHKIFDHDPLLMQSNCKKPDLWWSNMHKKVRIGHALDGTIKKEVLDSIWQEVTRLFAEYSIPFGWIAQSIHSSELESLMCQLTSKYWLVKISLSRSYWVNHTQQPWKLLSPCCPSK